MSERDLSNRVAVVTGSGRRIGRRIAEALAGRGAAVVINAKTSEKEVAATVAAIASGGDQASGCLADASTPEGARKLIGHAVEKFGRLDILVNNAAVRRHVPFAKLTYEEWREVVALVLDGAFLCAKEAAPHLMKSGHGRIINIGGVSSFVGSEGHAHVIAAKAGLTGLTRALAHDLGPSRVTVNMISPGVVEAAEDDPVRAAQRRANFPLDKFPLGRTGTPDDIANAVAALAGDTFAWATGQVFHVNGGSYMG
jgi:3-oxoacyl-[acyl-carrier protein] reductase